jgi:hypothetical protein
MALCDNNIMSIYARRYINAGNSGVVVEELTFRKQEFTFILEYTLEGENVTLLRRNFRLGKQIDYVTLY